ncbi:sigma 54-interacting transcriptional regulator [Vagococcus salmoninarum]|nr:sigma 54-interacting transcriptional regulator [Vagococcus salmoninarum]
MKKEEYLAYLLSKGKKAITLSEEAYQFATTKEIAIETGQKQTVVNHHLNNLFKEEQLIKINTKPVYYIPVAVIVESYQKQPQKAIYDSFLELEKEVGGEILESLIGSSRSLSEPLRQCKVALKYPNNGLPLLITGDTGTGKTFLVKQLYQYAIKQGILAQGAPLEIFNCAEYADNPELLTSKLFGYRKGSFTGAETDREGLIAASDGGILFIDEVHRLSSESQEKLFYFIDEGKYKPMGENTHWSQAQVRLMFATTEKVDEYLLDTFIRRIPIVTNLPSLDSRGYQEKKAFLLHFFKEEAKNIQQPISLSIELFRFLITYSYTGNVGEMKNLIKYLVGHAFIKVNNQSETVKVLVSFLPEKMKSEVIQFVDMFSETLITILPTGEVTDPDYDLKQVLYAEMVNETSRLSQQLLTEELSVREYINQNYEAVDKLIVTHKSKKLIDPEIHELIQQHMGQISKTMYDIHQIDLSLEAQKAISDYLEIVFSVANYETELSADVMAVLARLEQEGSVPYSQMFLLKELLYQVLPYADDRLTFFDILIFTVIVSYYYHTFSIDKIQGVIICHGHSTASSLSQTANQMIGQRVFHGIDMDLDVSFYEITRKLRRYLSLHETRNGTVVLIDIGHTEDLRLALQDKVAGPFAVIDNVSTKLALDVGFKIINKENITQLVSSASDQHYSHYSVFEPEAPKEKALIISCQTGIGTANKLKEIFMATIPKSANLNLVVTDFDHLTKMKTNTTFFARYDVLGSIGTTNPRIDDVPFLGLDDIMSEEGIEHLQRMFSDHLDVKEIHSLNNGLMKALSLENLVTMLSILNPEKTIQLISEMMEYWEKEFKLSIPNNLRTALYIHISCMIERVITRTYVENQREDLEEFKAQHQFFVTVIKKGLEKFEGIYHVQVDFGELAYLHQLFSLNLNDFPF